jgi:hypothetical protein
LLTPDKWMDLWKRYVYNFYIHAMYEYIHYLVLIATLNYAHEEKKSE